METLYATFFLSASLPGGKIYPCREPKWDPDSDSDSDSNEGFDFSSSSAEESSSAEDSDSGSDVAETLAEDSAFCSPPREGSEGSVLAENFDSGFDLADDAKPGATLTEDSYEDCAVAEDVPGSAPAEVFDSGSALAEKSAFVPAPPEDLGSGAQKDKKLRSIQCLQCHSNEFLLHQCWICGSFQGKLRTNIFQPLNEGNFKRTPRIKELRASAAHDLGKTAKCEFCPILLSCLERCLSPAALCEDSHIYVQSHEDRHDPHNESRNC